MSRRSQRRRLTAEMEGEKGHQVGFPLQFSVPTGSPCKFSSRYGSVETPAPFPGVRRDRHAMKLLCQYVPTIVVYNEFTSAAASLPTRIVRHPRPRRTFHFPFFRGDGVMHYEMQQTCLSVSKNASVIALERVVQQILAHVVEHIFLTAVSFVFGVH